MAYVKGYWLFDTMTAGKPANAALEVQIFPEENPPLGRGSVEYRSALGVVDGAFFEHHGATYFVPDDHTGFPTLARSRVLSFEEPWEQEAAAGHLHPPQAELTETLVQWMCDSETFAFAGEYDFDVVPDFRIEGADRDQLDVSLLTDARGKPVSVQDVAVRADRYGNAVLIFPGGEGITLTGVNPARLNEPTLIAMGIPSSAQVDALLA
ncbi:hypothetical protein J7400_01060 [Shimia sp. R9_2]|uniref:hypothetical protein n=1 Tax=Shimia sp. R9_2 TaxID=2821112 RepID=UPI001ADC56A2|nr:hypothetical protein [Shimia sp. R9_2]MBO9395249.1 hypothetical protein [Shimia sp. R9_2]